MNVGELIVQLVRLGQTDLKVSPIAFGTWAFGGDWGAADLRDSKASIHRALELGINQFDTAHGYGFGVAERLAFLGLGFMGTPMAIRQLDAGHDVKVWDRTMEKTRPLAERGTSVATTPAASGRS